MLDKEPVVFATGSLLLLSAVSYRLSAFFELRLYNNFKCWKGGTLQQPV
jgi:hypothetical protein